MSDLISIYNNLMSQISALRAEAKEAASNALHETTKHYFEKYGDTVEQIFWNQYTPWFSDGDTCEFSVGDIHIVLLSDESEDKYSEGSYFTDDTVYLKTRPEVLHAETNAIAKIARSTNSSEGASLFVTHAPCIDCAKIIHQSGINSVYYRNAYRSEDGVNFLQKCGVEVKQC